MYETSVDTLGHTTRKHQDWFDENDDEILLLLDRKRRTQDELLSQQTRHLNSNAKCLVGTKPDELQQLAEGNSSKGFFAAIKQVYGPQKTAVAPIRDTEGSQVLTDNPAIVFRWGNISASYC